MNNKKTVSIHGKEYLPVKERIHEALKIEGAINIETEVLSIGEAVLFKATVRMNRGVYTGHAQVTTKGSIESENPYEVAETSAVGRALGNAGFGYVEEERIVTAPKTQPGVTCTHLNQTIKTAQNETNKGRDYFYCNDCSKFVKWVPTETQDKAS